MKRETYGFIDEIEGIIPIDDIDFLHLGRVDSVYQGDNPALRFLFSVFESSQGIEFRGRDNRGNKLSGRLEFSPLHSLFPRKYREEVTEELTDYLKRRGINII